MTKSIQKISALKNLDPKIKKLLVEDNIFLFAEFMNFAENIIKNEDVIIQSIDRFRKIEKEIDIKTKSLTKH
jgi:adenine deaminase